MKIKSFLIGAAASVVLASGALASSSLVDPPTVYHGDCFDLTINSDGVMIEDLTAIAVIGEGDGNKFVSDPEVTTQSSVMIVVADLELDNQSDNSVNHVDFQTLLFAAAGDETGFMKKPGNVPIDSLFPPTGSVKNWPNPADVLLSMKPVMPKPLGNIAPFGWDEDVSVTTRLLRPHPLLDVVSGLENAIDVKPLPLTVAGVDEVIAPEVKRPYGIVRGGSRILDARTTDIIVMVGLSSEVKRPQADVLIDEIGV